MDIDTSLKVEVILSRDEALHIYEKSQNENPNSETLTLVVSWLKALPATAEIKVVKNVTTDEIELERVK